MRKFLAWRQAQLDNPSVACGADAPAAPPPESSSSFLLATPSPLVSATAAGLPPSPYSPHQTTVPDGGSALHTTHTIQAPVQQPQPLPTGTLAAASHLANLHQVSSAIANSLPSSALAALLSSQQGIIQASNPTLATLLQKAVVAGSPGSLAQSPASVGGVLLPPSPAASVAATLAAIREVVADANSVAATSSTRPHASAEGSSLLSAASPSSSFLSSGGVSAFSVVSPPSQQAQLAAASLLNNPSVLSAAALYPQLMCLGPQILEKFAPILRSTASSMATGTGPTAALKSFGGLEPVKPLPTAEGRGTDVSRYKIREPREWTAQDVVTWMLDTSRRLQIPFEDVNMAKFANWPGLTLINTTEADWISNDSTYGSVFYQEFQKLCTGSAGDRALEEYMRKLREEEYQRTGTNLALHHPSTSTFLSPAAPPQHMPLATLEALEQAKMRMNQANSLASTLSAALSPSMGLNSMHSSLSPQSPLMIQSLHQNKQLSPLTSTELLMNKYSLGVVGPHVGPPSVSTAHHKYHDYESDSDDSALHGVNDKIRKNKDGKPRKRSQHSKGNKLWEFIRDALKDPSTCPSIVRWEDPHEGVFRIVESERLARLWGERKNNQKMTYEKLSRAMRYYYNTKILLPVSGRRLVYKFGPSAFGWNAEGGPAPQYEPEDEGSSDDDEGTEDDLSLEPEPSSTPHPVGPAPLRPPSVATVPTQQQPRPLPPVATVPPFPPRASVIFHGPTFLSQQ